MAQERPAPTIERDPFTHLIKPMVPQAIDRLPIHLSCWNCEAKWHGMRSIVSVQRDGQVRICTKTGRNVSGSFPEIVEAFREISQEHELVVDGEIVYGEGKTMEEAYRVITRSNTKEHNARMQALLKPCVYMYFDILYLDGQNLMPLPLEARQQKLSEVMAPNLTKIIQHSSVRKGRIGQFVEALRQTGYEGVILKRKDSPYKPGSKSRDWLKLKFPR